MVLNLHDPPWYLWLSYSKSSSESSVGWDSLFIHIPQFHGKPWIAWLLKWILPLSITPPWNIKESTQLVIAIKWQDVMHQWGPSFGLTNTFLAYWYTTYTAIKRSTSCSFCNKLRQFIYIHNFKIFRQSTPTFKHSTSALISHNVKQYLKKLISIK